MANQVLVVLDKSKAHSLYYTLQKEIKNAIVIDESSNVYPPAGDDVGGLVLSRTFKRRLDNAEVIVYLGDPDSPIGPYDGKSWIIVRSFPWWRNRWNSLSRDIVRLVEEAKSSKETF